MKLYEDDKNILYNYEYQYSKNTEYEDEILIGNATSLLQRNMYIEMTVISQNDRVVRQTEQYFLHITSKVKRCLMTCILNTLNDSNGYSSYIGVFDNHDDKTAGNDVGGCGYFFALINGILNIGIRNGDTNNGTDILIPQNSFNYNTMKGYQWNQLYTYEIEYCAQGDVYFSINTGNGIILVHYYKHNNDITPDVLRLNLPIRYEIKKTGNQGNIGIMRQYATHLSLENKFYHNDKIYSSQNITQRGKYYFIDNLLQRGYIPIIESYGNSNNTGSCFSLGKKHFIPVCSIRLKSNSNRNLLKYFNIISYSKQKNIPYILSILKNPIFISTGNNNPNVTYTPIWNSISDSSIEYDINAKDINQCDNNIHIIKQIFYNYNSTNIKNYDFNNSNLLTNIDIFSSNIAGTPNIYTFCIQRINNIIPDILLLLNWIE